MLAWKAHPIEPVPVRNFGQLLVERYVVMDRFVGVIPAMHRDTDPPIPLIPYAMSQGISDEDLMALWDDELRELEEAFEQGVSAQLPAVQQGLHLRVVHVREEGCVLSH